MYEIVIGRSEEDRKKFGLAGTILLGKHFVKMGRVTSLSGKIYLDVARSHVVFVCGKRGGGKCVLGDTEVLLEDNSLIKIKDLFEQIEKNSRIIEKNDDEVFLHCNEKVGVISVENCEKRVTKLISHAYKKKIDENIFLITTDSGKMIQATREHPLLALEEIESNGQCLLLYKWKRADKININEKIIVDEGNLGEEKIKTIKQVRYSGWVYDLTIPRTHNFIGNNIVCHNSYTMGVVAEGMADLPPEIRQNLCFILLDTMGIYWTMKYPNKKDEDLLTEWGLKGKGLDVKIFTPEMYYKQYKEQGIPTDFPFSIKASELDGSDWQMTFDISPNEPMGVLIERIIHQLKKERKEFTVDDIIAAVEADTRSEQTVRDAIVNRLMGTEAWGVFSERGTPLKDLAKGGQVTVLDVSCYATMPGGWRIKSLIIALVAKKLFIERMIARKTEEYEAVHKAIHYIGEEERREKLEMPMVWLVIDEAHEFLPREGKTLASDPLITILREGRQPGISLILASQQPGKIHTDVMTQSDTMISHRITAKIDVDALGALMQSYMREGLNVQIDNLPRVKGAALIFDDSNERMYPMRVRPRFTWHGGEAPMAVPKKREEI